MPHNRALLRNAKRIEMTFDSLRRTFLACAVALSAAAVWGQAPGTGAIKGTVYDVSTSAIQQAQVTLVSETTDVTRSTTSDGAGTFTFPLLAPGTYAITVGAAGL